MRISAAMVGATLVLTSALSQSAQAATATAYVGTVLGHNAFTIENSGTQLYFHPQPDTDYVWMENNGKAADVIATYDGANRDGMKTFACTDIAYGQRLDSIKMEFDYYKGNDTTGVAMNTPTVNVAITDGAGHYAMWSATSGGTAYASPGTALGADWYRFSLDCTNLQNNTWGKLNEYNPGFTLPTTTTDYTKPKWEDIKGWTIAGFYDYQRTPVGGFEAWNQTLWSEMTHVDTINNTIDATPNEFGVVLSWGDTVGGNLADTSGTGVADRPYGLAGRLVRNYTLTVGGTAYDMTFAAGVVPEPSTIALLITAGLGLIGYALRRRVNG